MFRDTLRNVSAEDLIKNYHNLTPKQQEFFANLYNTVKSQQTGDPLSGVMASLWIPERQDTLKSTTNNDGKVNFENLEIPAENEITAGTQKRVLRLSGEDLETKIDTISLTDGNFNKVYYMTEKNVQPEDKQYTIIINSKDAEGNNLPNVNWAISSTENGTLGTGNTGSNSLDTLQFLNPNTSLNLQINSNKEEYKDYNNTKNISSGQSTITTVNELMKYLYELQASGKDSETKALLDSVEVKAFLNGQLLMSGNSLNNTELNLQTTQAGHSLDLKVLMDRDGYVRSDSIPITINEGQANNLVYELVKEQTNNNAVAYLWRAIRDPLNQIGTTADITITNDEFNYTDTRSVADLIAWKDTVPVNATGTTPYTIKIHPHVLDGKIPLYDLVKIISLSPNQTAQGYDDLKSLEQQVVLKGDLDGSDGGEAGITNVIFTASNGQQYTTTTNSSGEYRLGSFPTGTTGSISFVIPTSNPENESYFNHRDIPVGGTPNVKQGTVPLPTKVTAFEDSVLVYNPMMIQKRWTYPVTGEKVTIHPEYLKDLEGTSYNASWAIWGEQRVYNTPNSDNPDWPAQMGAFIEEHTGVPYKIIVVDTPRGTAPKITSLDPAYLQSIRNQMGINVETKTTEAGLTNVHSAGSIDGMIFHSTSDITLKCPEQGTEANDITYAIGMREFVGRNGQFDMTDQYLSFLNGALDYNIKVTDMTQDFANVSIIYTNMSSRAKKHTNTGLYTISEN